MTNPLSSLLARPLAISEIGASHLRALAANPAHYERFAVACKDADRPDWLTMDYLGNRIPEPMDREDGVRIIPLQGPITRGLGLMGMFFGMADTDRFKGWVESAKTDPRVSTIALHIQSPGGDAVGCLEAAQAVESAAKVKPVIAFCDDMMASAAYFMGARATSVIVAPSSLIGSIGTYVVLADDREYWKQRGIEFFVVRSGKFKGAGIDGYSPEQIANIQRMVDSFGAQFRGFVGAARGGRIAAEDMEGQVFLGDEAAERGFADGIANNIEMALAKYKKTRQ